MIDENIILAFQCDHPDEAEALFQEGVQSERERITNLLKLSHPATSAIVKAAIQSGAEPSDIFGQCFTARERAANSNQRPSLLRLARRPVIPRERRRRRLNLLSLYALTLTFSSGAPSRNVDSVRP